MALRLRVISDHRHRLGDKSTFVFGVSGGSIGRSAENDWVLPDDMRYVSGRHARVVFHKGRYLLQDTSSNGTYVNDNDRLMPGNGTANITNPPPDLVATEVTTMLNSPLTQDI